MKQIWTARILAALAVLFLLFDAALKFAKPAPVMAAFVRTGWRAELSVPLGAILLICTILFAIPRTSVLGGILLTGYLGGAVAENLRIGSPLFSGILFPIYFGVIIWASLWLRIARVRDLFPVVNRPGA